MRKLSDLNVGDIVVIRDPRKVCGGEAVDFVYVSEVDRDDDGNAARLIARMYDAKGYSKRIISTDGSISGYRRDSVWAEVWSDRDIRAKKSELARVKILQQITPNIIMSMSDTQIKQVAKILGIKI